jgi:sterol desaturase/sphingolipid hydroxylase (fatty acid hydroxylase superfamily)
MKKKKFNFKTALSTLFDKSIWLSNSVLIDAFICCLILLLIHLILRPFEMISFQFYLKFLNKILNFLPSNFIIFHLPPFLESLLATMVTMVSIDCASYFLHRGMHTYQWMWKIHSFHHSVIKMSFFSTHRQNPLETFILTLGRTLFAAIGLSLFHFFFRSNSPVLLINGLGAGFFFYMFTVNLHHSHIPVSYPKWIRLILVSPHVHHIHHSLNPLHFGKNYGVVFSFWDRIFGTSFDEEVELGQLHFGIRPMPKPSAAN